MDVSYSDCCGDIPPRKFPFLEPVGVIRYGALEKVLFTDKRQEIEFNRRKVEYGSAS